MGRLLAMITAAFWLAGAAAPALAQSAEATVWAEAQGDCDKLRSYVKQFSNGRFVAQGKAALQRLNCPDPEADARRAAEAREREAAARRDAEQRAAAIEAENRRLRDELAKAKAKPVTPPPQTVTTAKPAPAPFSLDWLHPDVRAAVVSARAAEQQAERVAADARAVALRAQDAAVRARRGEAGMRALNFVNAAGDQMRYEGEWKSDVENGVGVLTYLSGAFVGDSYAGQFRNQRINGLCVWTLGTNSNNTSNVARYEGNFVDQLPDGLAVTVWRNGDRFAGGFRKLRRSGAGVFRATTGTRNEGMFGNEKQNGLGANWWSDGLKVQQGEYREDKLVTPLSAP
jgi:hypothetical protein